MWTRTSGWRVSLALAFCAAVGCNRHKAAVAKPAPSAALASAVAPGEPAPAGCRASGTKPVQLGSVLGDVYGFGQDATNIYYTSWQYYGGRGDIGTVRKDGKGARTLDSLHLEPRALAVDDDDIYFTSGIRLLSIPKQGGTSRTLAASFSSKGIALDAAHVYGVPGDYGPYDRVARIAKKGGKTTELTTAQRPSGSDAPNGFSRIALDASGIYVTDSGHGKVLRFPLKGGKPEMLASRQKKPYDLALDGSNLYFDLALKGELLRVPKAGGKVTRIAKGLVEKAPIAADSGVVYATFAGKDDEAPLALSRVEDGKVTPIASVPPLQSVSAIAIDKACVYWVVRVDAGQSVVYALARH